jgi:TonB family protein
MYYLGRALALILWIAGLVDAQQAGASAPINSDTTTAYDTMAQPGPAPAADSLQPTETLPQIVRFVKASFPDSLVARGVQGGVELDLLISEKGTVDSAAVVKGLHPVLDSSALAAVRGFSFTPADSGGKAVPVILRYLYRFTIEETAVAVSPSVNLYGRVLEKGTRDPVSGCLVVLSFDDTVPPKKPHGKTVCIEKTQNGIPLPKYLDNIGKIPGQKFEEGRIIARTDSAGRFTFYSLPCGTVRVKVIAPGCKPYSTPVEIKKDRQTKTQLWVEHDSYNGYEIVVYGKQDKKETQSYTVAQQELKRVPGFNGEAVKLIQALPGVARPFMGGNEIIVRGCDNNDTKFYIDGIQLPYLLHDMSTDFNNYRGILNANVLGSLSLYPGGWGVRFGNALGGIIDMTTRPARKDRWHGLFDFNVGKSTELLLELPLGAKAGLIASFRENFLGNEIYNYIAAHYMGEAMDFLSNYYDYSARLDVQPSASHRLFATVIGAHDTMFNRNGQWMTGRKYDPSREQFAFGKNLFLGIAGWDWTISPSLVNVLRYGIRPSYFMTYNNQWEQSAEQRTSSGIRNDIRDELRYRLNERVNITAGLDMRIEPYTGTTTWYQNDTSFTATNKTLFGPYAAYLFCAWDVTDRLTLTPGLRYDYYPQLRYNGAWLPEFWNYGDRPINNHTRFRGDPSLRVSGRYAINSKNALTASVGSYTQSPDSIIIETSGKNDFPSEKGSQYTLGYQWTIYDLLSLNADAYFGMQWDRPRWTSAGERIEDRSNWMSSNGRARMEGLELLLRHDQGKKFFGWLAYSLSYSQRYDYRLDKWVEYDYNVLNNIQLVANWFLGGNNSFGLRFQYTDGYPFTPEDVQYYDATYFFYPAKAGETNSLRHPPYFGLDLRYEKKFVFKRSMLTGYIEAMRVLHALQFVKDKYGNPVYSPGELNYYNYDYSHFVSMPAFPGAALGITWEF